MDRNRIKSLVVNQRENLGEPKVS